MPPTGPALWTARSTRGEEYGIRRRRRLFLFNYLFVRSFVPLFAHAFIHWMRRIYTVVCVRAGGRVRVCVCICICA